MFKRYFLWAASDPIDNGCLPFLMTFLVFVVIGFVGTVINKTWGSSLLGLSFLFVFLAVVMALVNFFICRRYVVYAKNFDGDLLLKVKDGRVIEVKDRFWKEKGFQYCPVGLPEVEEGKFTVDALFSYKIGKVKTTIEVSLDCFVPQDKRVFAKGVPRNGFAPQELYDHVVMKGYKSVSEMIEKRFEIVVEATPEIQAVLTESNLNFFKLLSAFASSLNLLGPVWPLSNISKIEINLSKEDVSTQKEVVYPPREVEIIALG